MKRWYIFVMIKSLDGPLSVGYSQDILKTVEQMAKMPSVKEISRLIYMEIAENRQDAEARFEFIYKLKREEKLELIKAQNPDLITLKPGDNISLD